MVFSGVLSFSHVRTTRESLEEYGRGIAGGLIFSLPLLFTQEVWDAGFLLHPARILVFFAATFALLLLYNRYTGLRNDASWAEVVIDSIEELGIGIVLAALVLWIAGRIGADGGVLETAGMIMVSSMTVAIGVSVGTAQLGADDAGDEGMAGDGKMQPAGIAAQMALALCGAVLFGANIAPTEEIRIVGAELPPEKLLLMAGLSMAISLVIVRFSDFKNARKDDTWTHSLRAVISAYAVALAASAGLLFLFGNFDDDPLAIFVGQVITLAFPTSLGASAGRLLMLNHSRYQKS